MRKFTALHRLHLAESKTGCMRTKETRERIALTLLGRKHKPQHRKKCIDALRRHWAARRKAKSVSTPRPIDIKQELQELDEAIAKALR